VNFGRRLARLATDVVVRRPALWRLFRGSMRRQFDKLAPEWDAMRSAGHNESLEAALDAVPGAPRSVLDVGTGTGTAARAIAARWPDAEVIGVDVSERMVAEARRLFPSELERRVRFELADASSLPFPDGSFDLVALANMIPFFDELDRVLAPGGYVVFAWSVGAETPIYVASERLRAELQRRGYGDFHEVEAAPGTAFLARKAERG
jgi:ubiquinone/menaquinone biosynthesis C-methylase UbiE